MLLFCFVLFFLHAFPNMKKKEKKEEKKKKKKKILKIDFVFLSLLIQVGAPGVRDDLKAKMITDIGNKLMIN